MPTREEISNLIDDYWSKHLHDPHALRMYIKNWLKDEKKLSEEDIEKVMSDLQTYPNMPR